MLEPSPPTILGFGGTLNIHPGPSKTELALQGVLGEVSRLGARTVHVRLRDVEFPMYQWGLAPTEAVLAWAKEIHACDALILATPLYHGTLSGSVKNALDWLEILSGFEPPYLTDKPVALLSVAGGVQAQGALPALENAVRALRGWVVPYQVSMNLAESVFGPDGQVTDARVQRDLGRLAAEIVKSAHRFRKVP